MMIVMEIIITNKYFENLYENICLYNINFYKDLT